MSVSIYLLSLGCPKNLVDSENMLGILEQNNYQIIQQPEFADIIIVNTCGFIESAKEESINEVLAMAEYKKTAACKGLILAGCLGERYANELLSELPEVDTITGAHAWEHIADVVTRVLKKERFVFTPQDTCLEKAKPRKLTTQIQRTAYLKIAEGCDNACSYCAIPIIRGPYISKPFNTVIEEATTLAENGIREIVLVAQDVTRYGEDIAGKLLFPELLRKLCTVDGVSWIRILYAYPQYITDELIEVMSEQDKICKYIDIPLQHASNSVLDRMNRHDTKESIVALLDKLRSSMPDICIRTTFIVGFPEETEEEFAELKEFLLEQRFDRAGIFSYSQEDGTVAAEMIQVADEVKEERYNELMSIQAKISEEINKNLEDKELIAIVEAVQEENGQKIVTARSYREAPEIDSIIYLEDAEHLQPGDFVKVNIEQGFTYDLLARLAD